MKERELASYDLNLLVVLRALLETGSVTGAGARLGLSPSATSHALARIRDAFGDPMLVREGNAMVLTPRAVALRPRLERLLEDTGSLYRETPAFDPGTSTRDFTLAASDLMAPLAPELVGALAEQGPRLGLTLRSDVWLDEERGIAGETDLALQAMPTPSPSLVTRPLGEVDFVVVADPSHPFLRDPSLERWAAESHVAVGTPRPGVGHVAEAASKEGVERRIALRVPSFLLAMHVLTETPLLFSAPGPLARPIAKRLGLAVAAHPLDVPGVPVAAIWHRRFENDTGHGWFRDLVCEKLSPHFLSRD